MSSPFGPALQDSKGADEQSSRRTPGSPDGPGVCRFGRRAGFGTKRVLHNCCLAVSTTIDLFIRKLRARHDLSREEEAALRGMRWTERRYARGQTMVRPGEDLEHSMLITSGYALRSKFASDGSRQIVEVNVAGDFVDLHGFILKHLEHEIAAASRCEIAAAPHADLRRVTEALPRLSRVLWFQTLVDAAIHREWMLVLGKKRSRARVAQLFCEMHVRLGIVGLVTAGDYSLPFTQQELADMTGMTPVHLNRCLKELRDAGLVTYRQGQVTVSDIDGLARDALFDPNYLHLGNHEL